MHIHIHAQCVCACTVRFVHLSEKVGGETGEARRELGARGEDNKFLMRSLQVSPHHSILLSHRLFILVSEGSV